MAMVADARGFGTRRSADAAAHELTRVDIGGYVILVLLVAGAIT
jgi:hypothetical protein